MGWDGDRQAKPLRLVPSRGSTDLIRSGNSVHVAEKTAEAAPPSRRQENKRRTELALQQAALELFAKNGFDTTTTDEIAERAGVSPRTFFRYFPTKESVLFLGRYDWFQSFTEQYLAQPASLTDVEAVLKSLLALAPQLSSRRRSLLLYDRAVASSPTLRGGVRDHHQEDMDTLARAIARRRGLTRPDEPSLLLATVCQVIYLRSINTWLAGPATVKPETIVSQQFELLCELFTPASPGRRQGSIPPARRRASGRKG
jgi:AcrR family transcriptional regulator